MRRIRDFLCGLAFAAFTAVSVWGVILAAQEFPESLRRQPVSVRQWLLEHDLAQQSAAVRSRVAHQIEKELLGGGNLAADFRDLGDSDRARLESNLDLVLEQWYRSKVTQYVEKRPKDRKAWLDGQIKQFERAFGENAAGREALMPRTEALPTLALVLTRLETWTQRADPQMQQDMREFQEALQQRILSRQLRRSK